MIAITSLLKFCRVKTISGVVFMFRSCSQDVFHQHQHKVFIRVGNPFNIQCWFQRTPAPSTRDVKLTLLVQANTCHPIVFARLFKSTWPVPVISVRTNKPARFNEQACKPLDGQRLRCAESDGECVRLSIERKKRNSECKIQDHPKYPQFSITRYDITTSHLSYTEKTPFRTCVDRNPHEYVG